MRILHIHNNATEDLVKTLAKTQRLRGSNVVLFNVNSHRFPTFKVISASKGFQIIHVHNASFVGKWLKRLRVVPLVLHYTKYEIDAVPLHIRQKNEQFFDKIIVNDKESSEMGFHSTPDNIELDLNNEKEFATNVWNVYREMIIG